MDENFDQLAHTKSTKQIHMTECCFLVCPPKRLEHAISYKNQITLPKKQIDSWGVWIATVQ